jgi:hypothetical protein
MAADRITKSGQQPVVLEARDRAGGRVWSQQLLTGDERTLVERGAEFVLDGYDVMRPSSPTSALRWQTPRCCTTQENLAGARRRHRPTSLLAPRSSGPPPRRPASHLAGRLAERTSAPAARRFGARCLHFPRHHDARCARRRSVGRRARRCDRRLRRQAELAGSGRRGARAHALTGRFIGWQTRQLLKATTDA